MLPLDAGVFDAASPGGHPVSWVATGRWGGVSAAPYDSLNLADHVGDLDSAVQANRRRCVEVAALPDHRLVVMQAVHGRAVAVVTAGGQVPGVDALVATRSGLALLALAADCVPIALADPDAGVIAAVHCGWRGLAADVVSAAIDQMRALGAGRISAMLGPSICGDCYEVPEDRIAQVRSAVGVEVADASLRGRHIDVAAGVRAQLRAHGVDAETVPGCTAEDPALFSYRRDGVTGRQGMMIWQ